MKLEVDYKKLRVDVRKTLALCCNMKKIEADCTLERNEDIEFCDTVLANKNDIYNASSTIYLLYSRILDYIDNNRITIKEVLRDGDLEEEYSKVLRQLEKFREYYEKLANNTEKYDNNKKLDSSKIKRELKKNLTSGNYKEATLNYRTLINLYGVKKAKSIVKQVSKGTNASFKFGHSYKKIKYVVNCKESANGKKKEIKEKKGNVYSIVPAKKRKNSGAKINNKKTKIVKKK